MAILEEQVRHDPSVRLVFLDTTRRRGSAVRGLVFALVSLAVRLVRGGVDLVHLNVASFGSTYRKMALAVLCRLRGVPYVIHLHGGGYADFFEGCGAVGRAAVRRFFGGAAAVIVLGEHWQRFAVDVLGVPAHRCTVIPNGVPAGPPQDEARAPQRPGVVTACFLGRVSEEKGVRHLLTAWDAIAGEAAGELVLVGPVDPPGWLEPADLPPSVVLAGALDHDRAMQVLASSDVMVLPSLHEAMPMVVLEAMAHGTAIIATSVGSVPEVVRDGQEALLVPAGDSAALQDRLSSLMADQGLRSRLAAAARRRWALHHSAEAMAAAITEVWAGDRRARA